MQLRKLRSMFRRDKQYRKSFFKSAKPSLRYSIIAINVRHVGNIAILLFCLANAMFTFQQLQPTKWNNKLISCAFLTGVRTTTLYWIFFTFQTFWLIRDYSIVTDQNLSNFVSSRVRNRSLEGEVNLDNTNAENSVTFNFKWYRRSIFISFGAIVVSQLTLIGPLTNAKFEIDNDECSFREDTIAKIVPFYIAWSFLNLFSFIVHLIFLVKLKKLVHNLIAADFDLCIFNRIINTAIWCTLTLCLTVIVEALTSVVQTFLVTFVLDSLANGVAATVSYSIYKLWITPWCIIYNDWKYHQNIKNNIPTWKDEVELSIDKIIDLNNAVEDSTLKLNYPIGTQY